MKKILIADDDGNMRKINGIIIRSDFPDYNVEEFRDGISLTGRLEQDVGEVSLVLTDNTMPGINGSKIIERYAKTPRFKQIPMILIYGDKKDIGEKAIEDGAFGYLLKPFGLSEFTSLLKKALASKIINMPTDLLTMCGDCRQAIQTKSGEWITYKFNKEDYMKHTEQCKGLMYGSCPECSERIRKAIAS